MFLAVAVLRLLLFSSLKGKGEKETLKVAESTREGNESEQVREDAAKAEDAEESESTGEKTELFICSET